MTATSVVRVRTLAGRRPLRVVLVEDSAAMRQRLTIALEKLPGLELVGLAATALEATTLIATQSPDVVVLDLRLKEGTGFDVLRSVRRVNPKLMVFVLSNLALDAIKAECLAEGARACFDKSLEFEEFWQSLQNLAWVGPNAAPAVCDQLPS